MLLVSFGAGTNSTATLVGLMEQGIIPDQIIFADTGAEKPHTYAHLELMQVWCATNGFPPITVIKAYGESLEENCMRRKALPSVAYGFKTCSQRWKMQPQEVYMNNLPEAKAFWATGEKITRLIGFDAGEPQRAKVFDDPKYENWYPLINDWDWGRDECIAAIDRAGIGRPGKSSCYFCPSSKVSEIKWLAAKHPDLMDRAVAMERNAELTQVSGLGRSYRWEDVIATDEMFTDSFIDLDCGCYDG